MITERISVLKNRVQAGAALIEHLLEAHGDVIVGADFSLANELRKWVADAHADAPNPRENRVKRCGRLRRESNGTWWWEQFFLGWDGDPEASLELSNQAGLVSIALGKELESAAARLKTAGDHNGSAEAEGLLRRYNRWQNTGVWQE